MPKVEKMLTRYAMNVEQKDTKKENVTHKCGAISAKITHTKSPCVRRENKMASEQSQRSNIVFVKQSMQRMKQRVIT